MASMFSHAVAAVAVGSAFPPPRSARFWIYGIVCSAIPDIDVTGFALDVNYEDMLGHRGLTHSILFAAILGAAGASMIRRTQQQPPWPSLWLYLFLATVSHGILDAFTNGGLGVAFFSPFSNTRYFFAFQPIEVSPIGLSSFFSPRGLAVIKNEFLWIWIPSFVMVLTVWVARLCRGLRQPA